MAAHVNHENLNNVLDCQFTFFLALWLVLLLVFFLTGHRGDEESHLNYITTYAGKPAMVC